MNRLIVYCLLFLIATSRFARSQIATTVIDSYNVSENNLACDTSTISIGYFNSKQVVVRLPAHGKLVECTDSKCTTKGNDVNLGQVLSTFYAYVPFYDYSNYINRTQFVASGDIVNTQIQTSSLDFFQYLDVTTNQTSIRTFRVFARSSVPSLSTNASVSGGLKGFVNNLKYVDLDGDVFMHEFVIFSDNARLIVNSRSFNGTCIDYYCVFVSLPSKLIETLSMIEYDYYQAHLPFNRIALTVTKKFQADPYTTDIPVCPNLVKLMANIWAYCTVQTSSSVPSSLFAVTSVSSSLAYRGLVFPTRGTIEFEPEIKYVPFDPYSFSSLNGTCSTKIYDRFKLEAVYSPVNSECLTSVDVNITACLTPKSYSPKVPTINVTDLYINKGKIFRIPVFDANDFIKGEDDGLYSDSSFQLANGHIVSSAGIIFVKTVFETGSIYDDTCTNELKQNVLYSSTVFCYMSTDAGSYESTYYIAVDGSGQSSNIGTVIVENPHYIYACNAMPYDQMNTECTSVGSETNPYWATNYIRITLDIFDYSSTVVPFRVKIDSTVSHGKLYRCKTDACTEPGAELKVGDTFMGIRNNHTYMLYKGNDHYFNYAVFDMKEAGGIASSIYTSCVTDCYDATACINQCAAQLELDKIAYSSFYLDSFVDRKGVPFWSCEFSDIAGCPDNFTYSVTTPDQEYTGNTYRIYVSNVPSAMTLVPPRDTIYYKPLQNTTFEIGYIDYDLDTFDVVVEMNTDNVFIGSEEGLYVYITNETECYETNECKGNITVAGLPSDIKFFLQNSYMSYVRKDGDPLSSAFKLRAWKSYWGPGRLKPSIAMYDRYDDIPIIPKPDGFFKATPDSVYFAPTITVPYTVDPAYNGVVAKSGRMSDTEIAALVVEIVLGLIVPVPAIEFGAILGGAAKFAGSYLSTLGVFDFAELVYQAGQLIASIGKTLAGIGRRAIGAIRAIASAVRGIVSFLGRKAGLRFRNPPRENLPGKLPEPNPLPPVKDVARGFIPKDLSVADARPPPSFFRRLFPKRSAQSPDVVDPPPIPGSLPDIPAPKPPSITDVVIARVPGLGRLKTAVDKLQATRIYRYTRGVYKGAKNAVNAAKRLQELAKSGLSRLYRGLKTLYDKIGDLFRFIKRVLSLRKLLLLRKLLPLGRLRFLSSIFAKFLLYLVRSGAKLVADAFVEVILTAISVIAALGSALSWLMGIYRFTHEYHEDFKADQEEDEDDESVDIDDENQQHHYDESDEESHLIK